MKIYGDFFGSEPVEEIEDQLIGVRYEPYVLENVISEIDLEQYFGEIQEHDFLNLVYGQDK